MRAVSRWGCCVAVLAAVLGAPSNARVRSNGPPAKRYQRVSRYQWVSCRADDNATAADPAAASVRAALADVDLSTGLLRAWPVRDTDRAAVVIIAESDASVHAAELVEHYIEEGFDRVFFLANDAYDREGLWLREALAGIDARMWEVTPLRHACGSQGAGQSAADVAGQEDPMAHGELMKWSKWHLAQESATTCFLRRLQAEGSWGWIAQVDSDEYLHSRACPARSVVSLLREELRSCAVVHAPWLFYSFGDQVDEPCGRQRAALGWRWRVDSRAVNKHNTPNGSLLVPKFESSSNYGKYVARVSSTSSLGVHSPGADGLRCMPSPKGSRVGPGRPLGIALERTHARGQPSARASADGSLVRVTANPVNWKWPHALGLRREEQVGSLLMAVAHYRLSSLARWRAKRSNEYPLAKRYFSHFENIPLLRVRDETAELARANRREVRDDFMQSVRAPLAAARRPPMAVRRAPVRDSRLVVGEDEAADVVIGAHAFDKPPARCADAFSSGLFPPSALAAAAANVSVRPPAESGGSLLRLVVASTGFDRDGTIRAAVQMLCARGVKTVGLGVRCHVSVTTYAVHKHVLRSWAALVRMASPRAEGPAARRAIAQIRQAVLALARSGVHAVVGPPYGQLMLELARQAPRAVLVHVAQRPKRWAEQQLLAAPAFPPNYKQAATVVLRCTPAKLSPLVLLQHDTGETPVLGPVCTTLQNFTAGDLLAAGREYAALNAAMRAALLSERAGSSLRSGMYVAACVSVRSATWRHGGTWSWTRATALRERSPTGRHGSTRTSATALRLTRAMASDVGRHSFLCNLLVSKVLVAACAMAMEREVEAVTRVTAASEAEAARRARRGVTPPSQRRLGTTSTTDAQRLLPELRWARVLETIASAVVAPSFMCNELMHDGGPTQRSRERRLRRSTQKRVTGG